jgi:DNA-binding LacI/PurR family transcriptional regulator
MGKTVTVSDVAARAETSTATVSRVLNTTATVREDLRQRVLQASKELGYSPNHIARSLKQNSTHTVGVVISDIANPFFASVVRGIEDTLASRGYLALLCNTDLDVEKESVYIRLLGERRIDGVIISAATRASQHLKTLRRNRIPWVFINRRPVGFGGPAVLTDNRWGAFEACNHLIQLGHSRIGMLSGPQDINTGLDRMLGYREALTMHGIPVDNELIFVGNFTEESGYDGTLQLMTLPADQRPTALFVGNNQIAIGAIQGLIELKLRMPDDVALVTFDESDWAKITDPPLTTVAQSNYEMGQMAAHLLVESMIAGKLPDEDAPSQDILLRPRLIVRRSCGSPAPSPAPMPVLAPPRTSPARGKS